MIPGAVTASDGYYVAPITYPADLNGHLNPTGMVPTELLTTVAGGGRLHHLTARKWNAMVAAAARDGFTLTYSGQQACLRTLVEQGVLWRLRCTTTPLAGRPTRQWNGQTWWLLPGVAWPARPGESNHGLGIAIDAALYNYSAAASTALTGPALAWLKANAWVYGFTWEYHDAPQPEPWHVRDVTGDVIPSAVYHFEQPNPPPPTPAEDDMPAPFIGQWKGANAWFITDLFNGYRYVSTTAEAQTAVLTGAARWGNPAKPNVPVVLDKTQFPNLREIKAT